MSPHPISKAIVPEGQRSTLDLFAPVHREFNRILEDASLGWNAIGKVEHAPRMDVAETREALLITVELPGMSQAEIEIEVVGDVLIISGQKVADPANHGATRRVSERVYGAFVRELRLPRNVDVERIAATMSDGVLAIIAPKDGSGDARTIAIQTPG